jgi:hypothetical protein
MWQVLARKALAESWGSEAAFNLIVDNQYSSRGCWQRGGAQLAIIGVVGEAVDVEVAVQRQQA